MNKTLKNVSNRVAILIQMGIVTLGLLCSPFWQLPMFPRKMLLTRYIFHTSLHPLISLGYVLEIEMQFKHSPNRYGKKERMVFKLSTFQKSFHFFLAKL